MTSVSAYLGLFFSALLAATLFPAQSEAVLLALLHAGQQAPWLLWLVATLGNVLGALVNWWLGLLLLQPRVNQAWWQPSEQRLQQAQAWYRRYGRWSLLLSWMPVLGDPLTLVAGLLRERLVVFLLLVSLAKGARYLLLIALAQAWLD